MLLIIICIIIYVIGMFVYINSETIEKTKFYEGGFLGMGYTTHTNRDILPTDVRKALIWPILLTFWFIKAIICILNDVLSIILLAFNYKYKETKIYKFIDKKMNI